MPIELHYINLFTQMFTAREIDYLENEYTGRGEAYFHVSGAGHETVAAINRHLIAEDWLHCHYRDKALMLARGISIEMFFFSLFAKDASHSRGRQMSAHLSSPEHNILSLVGPVGNNALQAAGIAHQIKKNKKNPIVFCALGDGTSQEGEVLEAIAEAVRWNLPVLFFIENNKLAISTQTTGMTFFSTPQGDQTSFYGIEITRINANDHLEVDNVFCKAVSKMRQDRKPNIIILESERLHSHTNADDHSTYRKKNNIKKINNDNDPVSILEKWLIDNGFPQNELDDIKAKMVREVRTTAEACRIAKEPAPCYTAKAPLPAIMKEKSYEYSGTDEKNLTMIESIKQVLRHHLANNSKVTLYGEDIEDPKGDVFGLTRGLSTDFSNQVINSPLSESTIVGVGTGRALAGGLPVVFLQFADFLPIAFNQIISEIGSMYWRTDGAWQCPIIVMITCGGYRPGLGPFHAQTMEAIAAHTPGIDVMMPSTAADAAGLLNSAFLSNHPTLFFYPKSCLNNQKTMTSSDVALQRIALGKAKFLSVGEDVTLVSYGNCITHCLDVAKILKAEGISCDIIDLRCLSPWDENSVINSAKKTRRIIAVHEDNISCSISSEIGAVLAENLNCQFQFKRIARPDTHIPFHFGNQLDILPSRKRILETACELLNLNIKWQKSKITNNTGIVSIDAIGTSPSDESVTLVNWKINEGDIITEGQILAEYEADKATAELLSPLSGQIDKIIVNEGEKVSVGSSLLQVKTSQKNITKPITEEILPKFTITTKKEQLKTQKTINNQIQKVFIQGISPALASNKICNKQISQSLDDYSLDEIVRGTGIKTRYHINENEDAISLGTKAARQLLDNLGISLNEVGMLLVSTGTTGNLVTPSLACRILDKLSKTKYEIQAFDFSAACSGYIYGLQLAYDFLQQQPDKKVLFITSEVLSPLLDNDDYRTKVIFGDAATATILTTEKTLTNPQDYYSVFRPLLSSKPEEGKLLTVPSSSCNGYIKMDGKKIFSEGVRNMTEILKKTCHHYQQDINEIDLVIAHQANQRILDAVQIRVNLPSNKIYSNIEKYGNTSSSSIPLALQEVLASNLKPQKIALTAFGGGFTYGATLIEKDR